MLYDLQGEANMTPIVGILYSAVKENSQRLQLITEGMSQDEVDYKGPNNSFNSTAQLINHIMYVDLNWVYRMKGQPLPQSLKEQYGPMIDENRRLPMIKGKSLNTFMSIYEDVLIMLEDTCTQLTDADLDKVVTFGHENEKQATIRWGLWHMADHNRYHQAQINQLRKWYIENSLTYHANPKYNLQFEQLCNTLKLGEILLTPETISGGLLHRMFAIETTKGKFAIKALNPQIMARPTAFNNFITSERIANIAAKNLSAHPAQIIDGKFIHSIDNQYYLVFDWIDGCSLKSNEINKDHCEKMGLIVADIHKTDFSQIEISDDHIDNTEDETYWNYYLDKGQANNLDWVKLLHENIERLFVWSAKAKRSSGRLATDKVISHGDLEPKNVMWHQDNPIIIDWESAGYMNPMHDLIETAIYWSVNELGIIEKERFIAFINGYKKRFGVLQADWKTILEHGYLGRLDWLEYSLKRSLWIECTDEKEQQLGTLQVTDTINTLNQYEDMISDIETWLNKDFVPSKKSGQS